MVCCDTPTSNFISLLECIPGSLWPCLFRGTSVPIWGVLPVKGNSIRKAHFGQNHRSRGTGKSRLGAFMPFGFWLLGISLPSVFFGGKCDFWLVRFWCGLVGSVTLFWACRLVSVHTDLVQTAWTKMGSYSSKVPYTTWETLWKNFKWLANL